MLTLAAGKRAVYGRSRGRCERCRCRWGEEMHHRQPRGMGGSKNPDQHTPPNIVHLCRHCHRWIEAHSADAYASGWKVRHGTETPADVPIIRDGRAVYLAPDGTYGG